MAGVGVSNSSPLIVLGAAGRLDLLNAAFGAVLVSEEVAGEVRSLPTDLVSIRPVQDRLLLRAPAAQMDLGEASAIALACETPGSVLILDDKKGRRTARRLGLPVVGTIGLVMEAKRAGRIALAGPVIERLIAVGLFASDEVIRRALADVGE
jgi:predicted nucleic acid-binding protein